MDLLSKKIALNLILILITFLLFLNEINSFGTFGKLIFYFLKATFGYLRFFLYILILVFALNNILNFLKIKKVYFALIFLLSFLVFPFWGGVFGKFISKIFKIFGNFKDVLITILTFLVFFLIYKDLKKSEEPKTEEKKNEKLKLKDLAEEKLIKKIKNLKKEVEVKEAPVKKEENWVLNIKSKKWALPPIELLERKFELPKPEDLKANAQIIKQTLENFGIEVEIGPILVGPSVTQYTIKPPQGMKLNKITALQDNISLALAVHPIRIEAPIPGESLVGIEVPNKTKIPVPLGWILENSNYKNSHPLSFYLGIDLKGKIIEANLSKLPHLLICGATGSGKSVFIHNILISFLMKNTPDILRFILVDPKRVELSHYANIPHLITDPILEAKKTVGAFKWLIEEMERRYQVLLNFKARDIESYNLKVLKLRAKKEKIEFMPYIVMVIDELADLMVLAGKEIEASIVRLTQMARATGIHLILATQRPSTDVITGLIKSNISARVAFQVPSQIDSRIILDQAGAEKLLGSGDMLAILPDWSSPKRMQAPFIKENEIKKISNFWQKQTSEDIEKVEIEEKEIEKGFDLEFEEDDELYNEALKIVVQAQKASTSLLQRRLKIGYARAARILDMLEKNGIVGPQEGSKPRKVLVKPEEINLKD
jgi:S-DNA-T family DNA segregation ATPase FtsK/SpoIIIE